MSVDICPKCGNSTTVYDLADNAGQIIICDQFPNFQCDYIGVKSRNDEISSSTTSILNKLLGALEKLVENDEAHRGTVRALLEQSKAVKQQTVEGRPQGGPAREWEFDIIRSAEGFITAMKARRTA